MDTCITVYYNGTSKLTILIACSKYTVNDHNYVPCTNCPLKCMTAYAGYTAMGIEHHYIRRNHQIYSNQEISLNINFAKNVHVNDAVTDWSCTLA